MTTNEFHAEIKQRTQPLVDRLQPIRDRSPRVVHRFVTDSMSALIDLIGYHSDSTIDEYQNEILPIIDAPDYAEEYAACGYDNDAFADPESPEYRSFASEVAVLFAVHNQLSEFELTFLRNMSDMWKLFDESDDFDQALLDLFDSQMAILESL